MKGSLLPEIINKSDSGPEILSISQLTGIIKRVLENNFTRVWVEGEVSNFTHYASGHMYFSLKDSNAQIRCVMFSGTNRYLNFRPQNGMHVRVSGAISVYAPQGSYQLIVSEMMPVGVGELHQAFENLKKKLDREGLFESRWKKAIPRFPRRIGVVTSPDGAAICDIVNVISRRYPLVELVLCPARVQGVSAAAEIIRAIRTFQNMPRHQRPDVLIVGRGGGSIEDLWPFNEEAVARAVFHCDIPVISGVGHEVDFTICDFVADLRAPTPSAAAEAAVPDQFEIRKHLDVLSSRLKRYMFSMFETRHLQLDEKAQQKLFRPEWMIRDLQMTMDRISDRLSAVTKEVLYLTSARLTRLRSLMMNVRPDRQVAKLQAGIADMASRIEAGWKSEFQEKRLGLGSLQTRMIRFDLQQYRNRLNLIEARLTGQDPRKILEKGYAICSLPDGRIVTSVLEVDENEAVGIELKDGELECDVRTIRRNK